MGTSFSGLNFEHKITKKDFTLIRKFRDPRFGEVSEMKNKKTGKLVLMKEREIRHIPKYKDLLRKFTYRSSLSHSNLVPIYGFTGMDATDIFNQNSKVYVYFEYLQNDLLQTIRNRKRPIFSNLKPSEKGSKLQPFEEAELFGLMVQLVDVLEFLQRNKVYHGDIRPETCFISNEGIVKLVDRWCVSDEETLSDEDARQGNRRTFVTPALLRDIGNGIQRGRGDYKDDVFSLGMTLLECATLQSSNKMYDWNLHEIDLEQLTDRLFEVKEQYSPRLMQFLAEMLQFDDGKRPDFIELKLLLNGENQIGGGLTSRPSMHTSIEENVVQDGGIQSMNPKTMQALIKGSSATKTGKPGAGKATQRRFNNKPKKLAKNSKYVVKVDVNEEEIVQNTREGTLESLAGSKSNFEYNYDNKLGYDSNPQRHFPSDYFKNQGKLRSLNEVLQEAIFRQAQQQASLNDLNSLQDPKSIHLENLSSLRNAEPKDIAHTQATSNPSSHLNNPQSIPSIHNLPVHNYSKAVPLPKQASFGETQPNPQQSFLQNPDLKIHSKYLNLPKLDETFNENSSLSIHPFSASQTPLNSGVSSRTPLYYRSGYMNPFVDRYTPQAGKNSTSFKKALENHSINVPRSSNASFVEIPKKTVNLSYQSANLSYQSPQNLNINNENKKFTDLSTTEIAASNKLLVDTILEKVLNASGMKNGPSGRKSRGSAALNSVSSTTKLAQSQIIYDHPNQRNSSNVENKEPLRAQYLNHRTSHSTGGPINFNLYGSSLLKKENEVECKTIYLDYSPPPKERTSYLNADGNEQNFVESPSPQKKELLSSRLKDDIKSLMDETRQILYSTKNSLNKNPKLNNHKKSSSVLYGGNVTNLDNSLAINLNSSLKMEPGYISNESSRRRQSFYLQN